MKFVLNEDVKGTTPKGKEITWLNAGIYKVVRLFNDNRVIIDVTRSGDRLLTIVGLDKGELLYDE